MPANDRLADPAAHGFWQGVRCIHPCSRRAGLVRAPRWRIRVRRPRLA